ncbi:uncharacterized protein LOC132696031 isoform X2 [Cylas formicarius]|uniref:uncharacterized protein LOC132696031 isoform X2 n=1 Tax=Cylas formicarius TaxID=197179 RepID=UPI0029584871|nr:uncharacterized protein LOC132696031 isoform X2 [Cylas formicarius]
MEQFNGICRGIMLLLLIVSGAKTLKNVSVTVPGAVKKFDTVTLQCKYDLEGEPLYTVKWYKGQQEFYRYIPKELPSTQIFPLPGIDVDLSKSTSNEVVLRSVQPEVTGRFKCEVSTDAPVFDTQIDSSYMYVVEVPEEDPHLKMEKENLEYGYLIRATCTTPVSFPAMNVTWFLNGVKINASAFKRVSSDRTSSYSKIRRVPLSTVSYIETEIDDTVFQSGIARLQCIAKLFNLYRREEVKYIEDDRPKPRPSSVLGTPGQSSDGSVARTCHLQKLVLLLVAYYLS